MGREGLCVFVFRRQETEMCLSLRKERLGKGEINWKIRGKKGMKRNYDPPHTHTQKELFLPHQPGDMTASEKKETPSLSKGGER